MALHSTLALKEGVSSDTVQALRVGGAPAESKLRALSDFSRLLVRDRGRVGEEDLRAFEAAGYSKAQALEVILGVAVSIVPNFAHHLTNCPVDEAFKPHLWTDPEK